MTDSLWKPYVPSAEMPWDLHRVKHLHRRAAFGATWDELQRDAADGPKKSIDRFLEGQPRTSGMRDDFEEVSRIIGDAAAGSNDPNRLKAWWLFRILFTPDPLTEKLTLMWHNHFATSNLKVRDLPLMRQQNELFRENTDNKFGELLRRVLHDPAMLFWLDANSNRKGHPNENLARELMELFTLGVGNYSEHDVKESARALTGWTVRGGQVKFRNDRHDSGAKTILGERAEFAAGGLTDLLLTSDATSRRLAWRLCDTMMGEGVVSDSALKELASGLREHDLNIAWAVETVLRSELFFSDANIASRISSPVEFVAGTVRSLELLDRPPSTLILADWCSRLGQDLFYPPNVGGWTGGRSWLTSRTIVGRSNFAAALVKGELCAPPEPPQFQMLLEKVKASTNGRSNEAAFAQLLLCMTPDMEGIAGVDEPADMVARLLSRPEAYLT